MKIRLLTLLASVLSVVAPAQSTSLYFADYPTLTPDGRTVIFSYEGDLWQAPAGGGGAVRLTAMEGIETRPAVSPDGRWLAFTGGQYGNDDIFLMPLSGGQIRQLTVHEAADAMQSWAWDSRTLYFTSSRYNQMSTYAVGIEGGTPRRLFGHYFNTVHNLVEHPKTGEFFFNESWESSLYAHRKGYKGAYNPDIKSYNPQTGAYRQHTDYEGKDFDPTVDRQGNLYFLSDEHNGEYNLYLLTPGKKKRLTNYDRSAYHPKVSADGSRIVFQRDYQLFIYETGSGQTRLLDVQAPRNLTLTQALDLNVRGEITAFDVAADGKKLAFISRGELFVSDTDGKFIRRLATRPDGRVLEVYWLKDNRTLLFNQTVGGYQNWFTIPADGSGPEIQRSSDSRNHRDLAFNRDKSQAVYISGRDELRLLDLNTFESRLLHRDELWGFYNDRPSFSPDDRYVLFTAYRNFERDILLCDLREQQVHNLTQTGVSESAPAWSPDGRYIYFTSDRTHPNYPYGSGETDLYRMALQRYDAPFRAEKFEELFADSTSAKKDSVRVFIDFDRPMDRIEPIGPRFGQQGGSVLFQDGEKTTLLYISNHDGGRNNVWKTVLAPFEDSKTTKIEGAATGSLDIRAAKGKHYLLAGGNLHRLNLDNGKPDKIDLDFAFSRDLRDEFEQMFYETWANLEENFYDENFHGVDWAAMRDRYAAFLPHLNNRNDLRRLLNDLLGELNTSHFGFRSNGKEEDTYYGTRTLATGIVFDETDPYHVARLVAGSPADRIDKDIRPGDRLIAVDGRPADATRNREVYFSRPARQEELTLTFRRDDRQWDVRLHPVSYTDVRDNLYDEWEADCRRRVDERGRQRIAYVHLKNMGLGELDRFLQVMVAEGQQRDALVLDLRYNTGGNIHDAVLQFLSQRPYLQWKYRGGALSPQPNFTPAARPIVLLINEQSLSDAEMTAAGFKQLRLGTVVGTETYRWIIFTSGKSLVDGSFYRLPSWGCYTLDGKNLEKTGVAPDVFVRNTFKDRIDGRDPQLDRAIDLLMEQLKAGGKR